MTSVIGLLAPLFDKGWQIRDDGKIIPAKRVLAPDKPFRSANLIEHGYECSWEMDILFEVVYQMRSVPIRCLSCYKVLLKPTTLADVLRIEAFQQAGGFPCKVGMEIRATVKRPWGAYWYCDTVEEGRDRYRYVKEWAEENLNNDWSILLKRGCTEYEQSCGRSDRWQQGPTQRATEDAINEAVIREPLTADQPQVIVDQLHIQWENWDKIMQPYVTYHEEKKEVVRRRKQFEKGRKKQIREAIKLHMEERDG